MITNPTIPATISLLEHLAVGYKGKKDITIQIKAKPEEANNIHRHVTGSDYSGSHHSFEIVFMDVKFKIQICKNPEHEKITD